MTIIIHFAGGIESISFLFYIFVIASAGFIYQRFGNLFISALAIGAYNTLIYSEFFGFLPHYSRYVFGNTNFSSRFDIVFVNTTVVTVVLLTTSF